MTLKMFKKIDWKIAEPLSQASAIDNAMTIRKILDTKVPIKKDDRVAILSAAGTPFCDKGQVVLSLPIRGKSVQSVMNTFEKGFHTPIAPSNDHNLRRSVYAIISTFCDSNHRLNLVAKFENGTLQPWELYGDHIYFEGVYRKGKYLYIIAGS